MHAGDRQPEDLIVEAFEEALADAGIARGQIKAAWIGNALDDIPQSYVRYLERCFMDAFDLKGTPLRIQFRTTHNPYATRR